MSFSASLSAIRWGSIVPYPLPLTGFWMSFPTRADNFILLSRLTLNWLARGSLGAPPSSYDGGARVFQATLMDNWVKYTRISLTMYSAYSELLHEITQF